MAAFGLRDSISDIIDNPILAISHYDYIVGMTSDVSEEEADQINAEPYFQVGATNIRCIIQRKTFFLSLLHKKQAHWTRTTIMTSNSSRPHGQLPCAIVFWSSNRAWRRFGLYYRKLAKMTGCRRGRYRPGSAAQDRTQNASGEPSTLTVTGAAENYVGSYLHSGPAWHSLEAQDQAADIGM